MKKESSKWYNVCITELCEGSSQTVMSTSQVSIKFKSCVMGLESNTHKACVFESSNLQLVVADCCALLETRSATTDWGVS